MTQNQGLSVWLGRVWHGGVAGEGSLSPVGCVGGVRQPPPGLARCKLKTPPGVAPCVSFPIERGRPWRWLHLSWYQLQAGAVGLGVEW